MIDIFTYTISLLSFFSGIFAVLLFIVMFMTVPNKASESLEYSIWCIGNCDTDAVVTTTPGAGITNEFQFPYLALLIRSFLKY